jgi:thioredoxin reductase
MERCDVAIIGAGPYGLAAAAHLRQVKGLDVKLFGEPMSFWADHMPDGMCLRSPWGASHIADPRNEFSLDAYRTLDGNQGLADPVPLADFIRYGRWVHDRVALPTERTKVSRVDLAGDGYRLVLQDDRTVDARRVVVAGGIQPFAYRPTIFRSLPRTLVTHSSDRQDFRQLRDKDVLVVGGGQSAIESAALLSEAGARVEVLIRNSVLHWVGDEWLHTLPIAWMFYGRGDVGPAGLSRIVQHPHLFRRLPRRIQTWWGKRAVRPAASYWVRPRATGVTIRVDRFPVQAQPRQDRLHIRLNDGSERVVDHAVLGTGYRIHVARYPFLSPQIVERLDLVNGYPRLDRGFETSLPSLHFVGAPAAWSFGPLMRFVAGTPFAARSVARRISAAKNRRTVTAPGIGSSDAESLASEAPSGATL